MPNLYITVYHLITKSHKFIGVKKLDTPVNLFYITIKHISHQKMILSIFIPNFGNMKRQGTLLIVDDNKNVLTSLRFVLTSHFDRIITLSTPQAIQSTITTDNVDVVLLDMNFSAGINTGNEGLYWLGIIKGMKPDIEVVLFTAYADIQLAVEGMKKGVFDFIVKPWDNAKLIDILTKALKQSISKTGRTVKAQSRPMFWGKSKVMQDIRNLVEKTAHTDANILITGENGTGKEVLAREIHRLSTRHEQDMITVDVGSIPDTLFESEMFGHVKGAFTDARNDRTGRMQEADKSTLFLDEIGNISLTQQAKLLTALQQRSIVKVGSNKPIDINIRLICATNRDIEEMVACGEFREDLLYRINTIHIHLPSLNERNCDIAPLALMFMEQYKDIYHRNTIVGIDDNAIKALETYQWNGNIRELQHVIEKAVILTDGEYINSKSLQLNPFKSSSKATTQDETIEGMERKMIFDALSKYGNNLSLVASKLGITRQTLYNKMKRYGL